MQIVNQWVVEFMFTTQVLYLDQIGNFYITMAGVENNPFILPIAEDDALKLIKN